MTLSLAIVEGTSLFAAVCGALLLWASPLLADRTEVASLLGKALTFSLCCSVSFYYNDLYDLRIVRSLGEFATRLLQGFGVAFILLAAIYGLLPAINISNEAFFLSLVFVLPALLVVRALTYTVMQRQPFLERVLILGTSPLAHKIVREIESRPDLRCIIVGVAEDRTDCSTRWWGLSSVSTRSSRSSARTASSWRLLSGGRDSPSVSSSRHE
jgi:FlaA1/EpsC-like NDP-sugar epimerase